MTNWVTKTALEQMAALKSGAVSAVDILEQTIERSEQIAAHLNPFAIELFDRARKQAVEADRLLQQGKGGKLCGLPVTVKDSQWLAGVRCANGSPTLVDFVPDETCTAIQKLEEEGAIIFAKTTCPEFSLSGTANSPLYGSTYNPWGISKTPGGSSGGAAASIAAGAGALSLGGDGGGSIRIPAAFCGIVGFKPTHGAVTRRPGFTTWDSLVAYGPMCRSVADAQLMFSVIANEDSAYAIPRSLTGDYVRVIASEDLGFAPVEPAVRHAFQSVIRNITANGFDVMSANTGLPSSVITWATIATRDMWEHKGNKDGEVYKDPGEIGAYANDFIEFGNTITDSELADAQAYRRTVADVYIDLFKRYQTNILITPTLGCEAFEHDAVHPARIENTDITYPWLDWAGLLYDANLVGMPSCCIPMGLGDNGLPVSLQILGAPGSDWEVLDVASKIEKLIDWEHQVAPYYSGSVTEPLAIETSRDSDTVCDVLA